jgi:hypothetical protein
METLSADLTNFSLVAAPLDASPIAEALNERGGTLTFWSDAITALQSAVGFEPSGPGSTVLIAPNP